MKHYIFIFLFCYTGIFAQTDSVELEEIIQNAYAHYPVLRTKPLVASASQKYIQNIKSNYYPQLSFSAQASYQSDVTNIPLDIPNFEFETLSKDQYKIQGVLSQTIYDGGITKSQAQMTRVEADIELSQTDMEWETIREQIIQAYFKVLLLRAQKEQHIISRKDIEVTLEKIRAGVAAGTVLETEQYRLEAEKIKLDQGITQIDFQVRTLLNQLSLLSNHSIPPQTGFRLPISEEQKIYNADNVTRLKWFQQKRAQINQMDVLQQKRSQPNAKAFIQGGYGKPGLNFLKNSFEPYYIAGIQLSWNLNNLYTAKNDRQILQINQHKLNAQEESFRIQLQSNMEKHYEEMASIVTLLSQDEEILQIRQKVKETAKTQMEKGVINVSDYLKEFHAEEIARINREIHQVQWIRSQYLLKHISGNL